MNNWKDVVIAPTSSILDAMKILEEFATQLLIITTDDLKVLGTITDGDIRRGILKGISLEDPCSKIMFEDFTFAYQDIQQKEVISLMKLKQISGIPILDKDRRLVDIKSFKDFNQKSEKGNKVILMAGGLGSRLGDLTKEVPKPLLKVGKTPILENIIKNFNSYGFYNFYLSVNYKSEMIEEYFKDGSNWNSKIEYLKENKKLGTAGALSLLADTAISEPFIVMNGDLLTKVNFSNLLDFHNQNGNLATMCIREFDIQIPYGVVNYKDGQIQSLVEKPTQSFFVNAGIYIFSPEILKIIPRNEYFDMTTLFEKIVSSGEKTGVFPLHEYWLDIGKIEDLNQARKDASK